SEGAAMLLLEERGHAARRGARVHAELRGFACAAAPPEDGAIAATMAAAAAEAGVDAPAVCCASVVRSPHWETERDAIARALPAAAARFQYRSALGHALGASGAVDAALALADGAHPEVLVNSIGFLGQAATLAFSRRAA